MPLSISRFHGRVYGQEGRDLLLNSCSLIGPRTAEHRMGPPAFVPPQDQNLSKRFDDTNFQTQLQLAACNSQRRTLSYSHTACTCKNGGEEEEHQAHPPSFRRAPSFPISEAASEALGLGSVCLFHSCSACDTAEVCFNWLSNVFCAPFRRQRQLSTTER